MVDVKPDTEERERPRTSSSSSNVRRPTSGSRPSSAHRLDTASLAAALPNNTHQSSGIRSRITVVCAECKRLKLKCDRRVPCGSCVKRDTTNRCQYTAAASEKIDVTTLHNRLTRVEDDLRELRAGSFRPSVLSDASPKSLLAVNPENGSSVVVSLEDVNNVWLQELDVQFDAELTVLQPDVPPELGWAQIFPSAEVFFPNHDPNAAYGLSMDNNMPTVTPVLLQKLPDGALRAAIMDQFRNTLAIHPCTNWNDFTHRAQGMFNAVSPQSAPTSLTFFACVAAAFALGAQSLAEAKRWGSVQFDGSLPTAQVLSLKAEEYFSLSQSTLQVAQRTAAYDLDFLMTMRMQCLYLLHDGKPRVAQSVLPEVGKMVNIARTMGLHVDPDEHPGKYSVFDAEMRRRMWWDIYYLDVFISDCMALPALIDDMTFTCRLPSDCDDTQLTSRSSSLPHPTQTSDYQYFILKSGLARLVKMVARTSIRNDKDEPSAELAVALTDKVKAWYEELPPQFYLPQDEAGAVDGPVFLVAQRCELASVVNQIYLKIWHPLLRSQPMGKGAAAQSVVSSINAAHQLIHSSKIMHMVMKHTRPATYLFYSFGRQLFHAAVICAYSLINNPDSIWAETALRNLETALAIMRDPMLATGRGPARGGAEGAKSEALSVIEKLLAKGEQSLKGHLLATGQKRKHTDLDQHLRGNFLLPYIGAAVATVPEDQDTEQEVYDNAAMDYQQHEMPYVNGSVVQPAVVSPPVIEQPQQVQIVQQPPPRVRAPTHPPPETESPYVPVTVGPEWSYQQKPSPAPPPTGKERVKARPSIGFRRRDTEPANASNRRMESASSSGSSVHSPVSIRKASNFNGPPSTSGVTMPGAAHFAQAQVQAQVQAQAQAQQEFAQQQQYTATAGMNPYYPSSGMYGPPTQQQHQQMFYSTPVAPLPEEPNGDGTFQASVNPALISPDAAHNMQMHVAHAGTNMAPSIPSTPIDHSRYNSMLPVPPPTKQDVDESEQVMLPGLGEPALAGGFDVPIQAMGWDGNAREAYPQEHWQGYTY